MVTQPDDVPCSRCRTEVKWRLAAPLVAVIAGVVLGRATANQNSVTENSSSSLRALGSVRSAKESELTRPVSNSLEFSVRGPRSARPLNELFQKLGITPEDWDATQQLNARAREGEYILKLERPTTRKFLEFDFRSIAAAETESRSAEMDSVFSTLSVEPRIAERLKQHMEKIHRASLEAEMSLHQLFEARHAFSEQIKEKLTKEQEMGLTRFVQADSARREMAQMSGFFAESGEYLDEHAKTRLTELIVKHKAHTAQVWHGPFDGPPEVSFGNEQVASNIRERADAIHRGVGSVITEAESSGIPTTVLATVRSYYDSKIASLNSAFERLRQKADAHAQ